MEIKTFKSFVIESLNSIKLDSNQLFLLQEDEITAEAFAMNTNIDIEDAKWVESVIQSDNIDIVSSDQMTEKYDRKKVQKVIDNINELEKSGVHYGSEIGLSPEEKKEREEQEQAMGIAESEDEKESDDGWLVKSVATDFLPVDFNQIQEYFWKQSGISGYLYFVIEKNEDVEKLINRI